MKQVLERVEQTRVVYRGLTKAAKVLGCSRSHLSYVLHGKRPATRKMARELKRLGVACTVDGKAF